MRTLIGAALVAFALTSAGVPQSANACDAEKKEGVVSAKSGKKAAKPATANFRVEMKCGNCADKVKTALMKQDGVLEVTIHLADNRVVVSYDAAKLDPTKIAKAIKDGTGYTAETEA